MGEIVIIENFTCIPCRLSTIGFAPSIQRCHELPKGAGAYLCRCITENSPGLQEATELPSSIGERGATVVPLSPSASPTGSSSTPNKAAISTA